jgi:uncharacterized protein YkwD
MRILALLVALTIGPSAAMAQSNCTVPGNAPALTATIGAGLNQFRESQNLDDLGMNRDLAQAALIHACDMALNDYFSHRGSDGSNSEVRVRRAGYHTCLVAENLAWGYPDPAQVVNGWIASPGHRQNMLLPRTREYGVGVVDSPKGPLWVLVMARRC